MKLLTAMTIVALAARAASGADPYTIHMVNAPNITDLTYIGNDGVAVGTQRTAGGSYAGFVTDGNWIASIAGPAGAPAGISRPNAAGDAVGSYAASTGQQVLGIFHNGQYLNSNISAAFSQLDFINDSGSLLGSTTVNGIGHALLEVNGSVRDLGTLGASSFQSGFLNNGNEVAATSYVLNSGSSPTFAGVLWDAGKTTNLGSLGGVDTAVADINNIGTVVGASELSGSTTQHGYIWQSGKMRDVGVLVGEQWSQLNAINDSGLAVGASGMNEIGDTGLPVFWNGSSLVNLNSLLPTDSGWVLNEASDINDFGQIVGTGTYEGVNAAYILTPDLTNDPEAAIVAQIASVPEPSTLGVVTIFASAAALKIRRKQQQKVGIN